MLARPERCPAARLAVAVCRSSLTGDQTGGERSQEVVMSTPISGQRPAVVPRRRHVRTRTLLAIAVVAAAALAITVVLVVAISGGSNTTANSSGPISQDASAATACGVHYWGGTLVKGPPCANSGPSR